MENISQVNSIWNRILETLPNQPKTYDTSEDTGFWSNGSEILCPTQMECEIIADFFEDLFSGFGDWHMKTGYYDPFEDVINDECDDNTGFYYVDICD